jgi:L-lactate dehydrogenase (cytochrome)
MVSSNASMSYAQIIASAAPSQPLFFQLYKHANNAIAEKRVREVEKLGYKAIWLTADAIVPGNRERDIRGPWELEDMERGSVEVFDDSTDEVLSGGETNTLGTAGALIADTDRDMTWETVRDSQ